MTNKERKPLDVVYPSQAATRIRYASDEFGALLQSEIEQSLAQRAKVGKRRSVSDQFMGGGASRYIHFGKG